VCHICKRSKASITGRILNLPDPHRLITHLVTDSDGARAMIDETPERLIPRTA
jgi:hypothetical protein